MSNHRILCCLSLLVCLALVLGGCFMPPIGGPIPLAQGNLIQNPSADEGTQHWSFYTADASVQDESGSPSFASRNGAHIWQTIDITGTTASYAVLMGITASQTVGADGMGRIYGTFRDNTGFEVGSLLSNAMYARTQTPNEWEILADVFPVPVDAVTIIVYLEQSDAPGVVLDGTFTWFDDIELHLVDTQQQGQDLIDTYTVDHTW